MIQFNEDEVCKLIKAVTWYRDMRTGSDWHWDQYNGLIQKIYKYGEEASPDKVDCEVDEVDEYGVVNFINFTVH